MEIYPIVELLLSIFLSGFVSLLVSNHSFEKQQQLVDKKKLQSCKMLVALELDDFMRIFTEKMKSYYPEQVIENPSARFLATLGRSLTKQGDIITHDMDIESTGVYKRLSDAITRLAEENYGDIARISHEYKNLRDIQIILSRAQYEAPRQTGIRILELDGIDKLATILRT
jgi:hypothetical protein